jgi:hypothetical protein
MYMLLLNRLYEFHNHRNKILKELSFPDCGSVSLDNGTVLAPEGTTYGSMAYVTCNDDYVLDGDVLLRCQEGQTWSDYPVCVRGKT